jgi:hypothetical protein
MLALAAGCIEDTSVRCEELHVAFATLDESAAVVLRKCSGPTDQRCEILGAQPQVTVEGRARCEPSCR